MQLRVSLAAATLLTALSAQAEDYVSLQYLQYDENKNRTSVSAPSLMVNKDFGVDYTLNLSIVADAVSGATQTYYDADAASGASAIHSRGLGVAADAAEYGNVEYDDRRVAYSGALTTRFANRDELTVGFNRSNESDFYSTEGSAEYMHYLDESKNQSISLGASYMANEILVQCSESGTGHCDAASGGSQRETADTISTQLSFHQVLNSSSYIKAALYYMQEDGYLTNPYLNVVRDDPVGGNVDIIGENRPDSRSIYGVSLKYANAFNDEFTLQSSYRFYNDDWGIMSHTIDNDLYYEPNSDWLFKIGLRYYTQGEADFFKDKGEYFTNETYYSSDFRLGSFDALTYKTELEYNFDESFSYNISANYYDQSTDLSATYFITGFKYKF
jgi:hypothetical protein